MDSVTLHINNKFNKNKIPCIKPSLPLRDSSPLIELKLAARFTSLPPGPVPDPLRSKRLEPDAEVPFSPLVLVAAGILLPGDH